MKDLVVSCLLQVARSLVRAAICNLGILTLILLPSIAIGQTIRVSGMVKDSETHEVLPFCTVSLTGTLIGTTSDENGKYMLTVPVEYLGTYNLAFSFVGYVSDTVKLSAGINTYNVTLTPEMSSLQEVVVISGTMKEVSRMDSPIPVEIYSPALFRKNPTPSIFEALGMINGVQPQLNCNVCNTGDIHINGMEGPYTMILIDGMPIVSSLATVYGLSGIPNSMVKRIEVVKGPASTLYGSEAVGGLVNIITQDAITAPLLKVDLSATTLQEYNADVSTKWSAGKANALLGVNYFNFSNKIDINDDNFTDVTQQQRISVFNKWEFSRRDDRLASFALRYVYEDRWGGELDWTRKHRGSGTVYGESIYTNRIEMIGNYQLPVPRNKIVFDTK
jgi:outer membrane receptor for ferrienterochelin and colicins